MDNFVLYSVCIILGGAGACLISRWGTTIGFLDRSNDRSSHEGVVPKGGGIGILAAFFFCSVILHLPKAFWIPTTLLAIFSFWGDRSEISAKFRLLFQFAASFVLLLVILWAKQSPIAACFLVIPLAIFIVGTANYYNFMDGINGIAGITGVVAFGLLGWFATAKGSDPRVIILSACMSLACLGFLPFNVPKARAFMGDVGSVLLGVVFAGMVVWLSKSFLDFVCLSSFLFPFYADELSTMVVRIRDGDNLLRPHRRHLYQLLANEKGIAHWKISIGYGLVQLLIGLIIIAVKPWGLFAILILLALFFSGFIWATYHVRTSLTLVANEITTH